MYRSSQATMAFIFALAAMAGCASESGAPTAPPEVPDPAPLFDRIIFSSVSPDSYSVHNVGIWTMKPDGSDRRLLLNGRQWPESPTVSPDGKWVAFEDDWGLYIVDADGARLRSLPLPVGAHATDPKWSPDGQWIAFTLAGNGSATSQIYKIRPDGTGLVRLSAFNGLNASAPAWSADGTRLAYYRMFGTVQQVVIKDLATGVETPVVDSGSFMPSGSPSWSPDGTRLLYLNQGTDWTIGQVVLATKATSVLGSAEGNRPATFDPSGQHLLFGTGKLWAAGPAGEDPVAILDDGRENFEAYWTPASPASP